MGFTSVSIPFTLSRTEEGNSFVTSRVLIKGKASLSLGISEFEKGKEDWIKTLFFPQEIEESPKFYNPRGYLECYVNSLFSCLGLLLLKVLPNGLGPRALLRLTVVETLWCIVKGRRENGLCCLCLIYTPCEELYSFTLRNCHNSSAG